MLTAQQEFEQIANKLFELRMMNSDDETEEFIIYVDKLPKIDFNLIENKQFCILLLFKILEDDCNNDGYVMQSMIGTIEFFSKYLSIKNSIETYIEGFILVYKKASNLLETLLNRLSRNQIYQTEFENQLKKLDADKKAIFSHFYTKIATENFHLDYSRRMIGLIS